MSVKSRIKRWWHSKTYWVNIAGIAGLAPLASVMLGYVDVFGLSKDNAQLLTMCLMLFVTASNMYLRKNSPVAIGEEIPQVKDV